MSLCDTNQGNCFESLHVMEKTERGSGPSGLNSDGWQKIIVSSCFGTATSEQSSVKQ